MQASISLQEGPLWLHSERSLKNLTHGPDRAAANCAPVCLKGLLSASQRFEQHVPVVQTFVKRLDGEPLVEPMLELILRFHEVTRVTAATTSARIGEAGPA